MLCAAKVTNIPMVSLYWSQVVQYSQYRKYIQNMLVTGIYIAHLNVDETILYMKIQSIPQVQLFGKDKSNA